MTTKYFGIPFANSGDKTSIPDASQPSGDVSFEDGWTPDYAKDQATDPDAKDIPRQSENYFKFVISEAMKEIQEIGAKPYDALVNYPAGAIIPGSDNIRYNCQIANGPATSVKDPVGLLTGEWVQDISLSSSIQGGEMSNAADADHDITIQPCLVPDSLRAEIIQLKVAITKQIDAAWVAGNNAGGLFSGSVAPSTEYNVFLIKKDSDASIDAGFDISLSAANIPAGYTAFRRIGSIFTDDTSNIRSFEFISKADFFKFTIPVVDINQSSGLDSYQTGTITAPPGAKCEFSIFSSTADEDNLTNIRSTDTLTLISVIGLAQAGISVITLDLYGVFSFIIDDNSQLQYVIATVNPNTVKISTLGYYDNRR